MIIRDDHTGTLNGYVGVGRDHPAFRRNYKNIIVYLNYSGRHLTFSGAGNGLIGWPEHPNHIEVWWFGYDNAHVYQRRNFTKEARELYDMIDHQRTTVIPANIRRAVRGGEGHYTTWSECEAYCAQLARALKEMADGQA
jgi:hypothetical protein